MFLFVRKRTETKSDMNKTHVIILTVMYALVFMAQLYTTIKIDDIGATVEGARQLNKRTWTL